MIRWRCALGTLSGGQHEIRSWARAGACRCRRRSRPSRWVSALAQSSTVDEIAKYRAALQDGNPAELWEARGEGLWKEARGPKKVALTQCDLGLGPGVVKGAYAQMPRYFADADRVMDLESRIVWCMVKLQGFTEEDAKKNPFGSPERKSDMEAYVAYVTSESRGTKMNVPTAHPKEQEAYRLGREDVLLPRRFARFLVRDVPRRGRQAHPAAGPAQSHEDGRRAEGRTRPGPPIAYRRANCARSSGGCTTASASSASRNSSSRPTRRSR